MVRIRKSDADAVFGPASRRPAVSRAGARLCRPGARPEPNERIRKAMSNSAYRKIRKYLELLKSQRYYHVRPLEGIRQCPCGYKEGHTPPPPEAFVPFEADALWGSGPDSHAWFYLPVEIPEEMRDAPVLLQVRTERSGWDADNPQFLVYVDGVLRQGMDTNHTQLLLEGKTHYEVYLYGYIGPRVERARLYATICNLRPEVEKLWYDIRVPFESLGYLEPDSGAYAAILERLTAAVDLLDLYALGSPEFFASVARASDWMDREFYGSFCRPSPVTVQCIGHTHIDCAWLWTLRQTREKVQRSFATVLELMRRYPEYRFMSSQAFLYQNLREEAPALYEEVRQRICEGRWECEGSMWVEADCNLPSGESLVRQVVYGKRFFRREFGVENRILWLPDVFGYSPALPQILRKCGVEWFVTSKISWNDENRMPYDTFLWKGIDGTSVRAYFLTAQDKKRGQKPARGTTYVAHTTPAMVAGTWDRYQQKNLSPEVLLTFGYGDGGGGPTPEHLELARRLSHGIPGTPNARVGFAGEFFDRLARQIDGNPHLPVWQGELYLEFHRGTYTTQAKNKRNNRKSEFLYLNTEWLCCLDRLLNGTPYPKAELTQGWEMILTNQFHDIIPGSSIREVYEQCDRDYTQIRAIAEPLRDQVQDRIAGGLAAGHGCVVFNPSPFPGAGLVRWQGKAAYVAGIPAKGYACPAALKTTHRITCRDRVAESRFYRIAFDEHWQIVSLFDKENGREVIPQGCVANELRVYPDYPDQYDAWEWQEYSLGEYRPIDAVDTVEFVDDGARYGIRIRRTHMHSTVRQTVWLSDDVARIDFETLLDWHDEHQMLKVAFPVDVNAARATYECQYGSVERPTHKNTSWDAQMFEVCGHKYADLSEGNYGVALLNDCKYGYDIHDGVMQLSLLRCPTYPDETADHGESACTYSLYPHGGSLHRSDTVRLAYDLNNPMTALPTTGETDRLPVSYAPVSVDCPNVLCEVCKEAEESDCLILRLYEVSNTRTDAVLQLHFDVQDAWLCDMNENPIAPCTPDGEGRIRCTFRGFEIQTLKLRPAGC